MSVAWIAGSSQACLGIHGCIRPSHETKDAVNLIAQPKPILQLG